MRRPLYIGGGVALITVIAGVAVAASASVGTVTYEAEASANKPAGGAAAVDCKRCSGGSRVTGIGGKGTLTFTGLPAERDAATTLNVSYWAPEQRTAQVSVNDGPAVAFDFPGLRTTRPGTLRITVALTAGVNTVTFANPDSPAPDLDKLVITTDGTPPIAPVPVSSATSAPAAPSSATAPVQPTVTVPTVPAPTGAAPTGPAPVPGGPPAPKGGVSPFEAQVVKLVNKERVAAGCKALKTNKKLTGTARAHSADMAARDYDGRTTPEGVEFGTRIKSAGYRWSAAAENIARGQATPDAVVAAWTADPQFRANMVNCDFKDVGVGVATNGSGTLVWTQDLARPQ